ncbi:unnamed protein product [Penicillium salamii]|uniref:Elongation of fatty acids protein n=1 Tax=Penicillium salamii TaxID=1612424 RepID=A0A9W4NIW0_9EURO|nr:unnamed protein product [Penicillium salamii]CAG8009315.1 unnamed protein product [Penicillium salamii]CAG8022829.1 unnamed protein product [Penicillium salamii]CAG8118884.1 unnamed protein product [Penicillium salamii]CAG8144793.1 unnamed protein product [Penicillium salamii]
MNSTNTTGTVHLGLPPLHLFSFPPSQPLKTKLPLPPTAPTTSKLLRPISISPTIFDLSLDLQYPLTFAVIYLSVVLLLNRINASRGYKPWGFTKTSTFRALVVLHNALLGLYSAWTFYGICYTVKSCWPHDGPDYYTQLAETMCGTDSKVARVLSPANMNTIWDEGAAYIGWIFYISKFYEILDTMIILASGKKSSVLQTYHHAGVILCGWASMRYESPGYLVGIVLNSGIHALMYSYFTFQSLGFKIPMIVKRSLTSLQIAQFLTGFVWACSYLCVKYTVPFDFAALQTTDLHSLMDTNLAAMRSPVSCLKDSGEAFPILFTCAYLLPLILLFVRFFLASYTKQKRP